MNQPVTLPQIWSYRTPKAKLAIWSGWLALVALFVWSWQLMNVNTMWVFVWDAPTQAADIASRMFPPRWDYINELWLPLWDTLNIATLGTLGGIVMAVPWHFWLRATPRRRFCLCGQLPWPLSWRHGRLTR
ncbi:MAG: hypothetical protein LRY49_00765 [Burkholderiaceae bacterium]|nr:hypothetical protein [Burkholderiaceae bacterium]